MRVRLFTTVFFLLLTAVAGSAVAPSVMDSRELTVVYDPGLHQTARRVLSVYPAIRRELEAVFQWPLKFRPTLVLIGDHKRFQQLAGHELVVAYALPAENVMVIDSARMKIAPFNLRATIKHELCHLLLHTHISDGLLPRWLDEGICQWASDGLADIIMDSRRARLPAAVLSGRYFDLEDLKHRFPREKNALILAYEQSKSVVDYMNRKYGSRGVLDLLELLRQGYKLESAVRMRFAVSFDQFENQWRHDLKKNINWFTYLSTHLYEILFVSAALLTILGFILRVLRKKSYESDAENLDGT